LALLRIRSSSEGSLATTASIFLSMRLPRRFFQCSFSVTVSAIVFSPFTGSHLLCSRMTIMSSRMKGAAMRMGSNINAPHSQAASSDAPVTQNRNRAVANSYFFVASPFG
jgi:hypothetical protein